MEFTITKTEPGAMVSVGAKLELSVDIPGVDDGAESEILLSAMMSFSRMYNNIYGEPVSAEGDTADIKTDGALDCDQ